jgi:uncharacterized protein YkuJ
MKSSFSGHDRPAPGAAAVVLFLATVLLSACGGGGGGGGPAPTPTPPPPAPGNDATLSSLDLGIPLDQPFQSSVASYTASADFLTSALRVTVTTTDAAATATVNGDPLASGVESDPVPLPEGSSTITVEVTAEDGTTSRSYVVDVAREAAATFAQRAYAKASSPAANDQFGFSVAVSGDTVAVGAISESSSATGIDGDEDADTAGDSGAVYVFAFDGSGWSQQAYLKASNTGTFDVFGWRVALDGDTLAVGAPSEDSGARGVNGDQNNDLAGNSGAVYVFERTGTSWAQTAYLKASNADAADEFGYSVALSGDTLAVGARGEDSAATGVGGDASDDTALDSGAAYVFVRSGGAWTEQAYLKASNASSNDQFGFSIDVDGDSLVVGSIDEASAATGVNGDETDDSAPSAGAAYVFARSGNAWTQLAYLKASNTDAGDEFAWSLDLDGDRLAVGARREASAATGVNGDQADDTAGASGAAYLFERSGSTWSQTAYLKASNADASDEFGYSVALAGDTLAVGARGEASAATGIGGDPLDDSAASSGAVYLFDGSSGSWIQTAYVKASNAEANDLFGFSVALGDGLLAVGASSEDSASSGIDGNEADDTAGSSGAAYLFR